MVRWVAFRARFVDAVDVRGFEVAFFIFFANLDMAGM